jgi:hypothetical protein
MEKFWKYFKLVILVWGFICLGIVLFIVVILMLQSFTNRQEAKQEAQIDTSFKKTIGDISLIAREGKEDSSRLYLTITKRGKPLVTDYELPTEQLKESWSNVGDARIYSTGNGGYSIILFLESESDHDYSHKYILQFSLNEKMEFDRLVDLAIPHKIPGDESLLFGNRVINLPSFENEGFETIDIPVLVKIGTTIKVCPMLNQRNLELQKRHYGKVIQHRIDLLSKSKDAELQKQYLMIEKEFDEISTGDGGGCE